MENYTPPQFNDGAFNCPHCNAFAHQQWSGIYATNNNREVNKMKIAYCVKCDNYSLWLFGKIIYPEDNGISMPNLDLDQEIQEDYNEARLIVQKSPRGACALLRLALQKLCKQLGEKGKNINDDIASFLALMLNNKADFILEYNEKNKENLKREDVDWSQSRVLFLANYFTAYQQNAINFKDLPIELWEVKKYDNETILYNQLKSVDTKESVKTISKNKTIENVSREVKKYSIEDHFKNGWENSRDLFENIRSKILEIDSRIEEKANKYYIAYKIGFNMCSIHSWILTSNATALIN